MQSNTPSPLDTNLLDKKLTSFPVVPEDKPSFSLDIEGKGEIVFRGDVSIELVEEAIDHLNILKKRIARQAKNNPQSDIVDGDVVDE